MDKDLAAALAKFGVKNRSKVNRAKRVRVDRELPEQAALVEWAKVTVIAGVAIGEHLTHIPNEGKRGYKAQSDFKRAGGRSGYPDLTLDIPTTKYHGLRIEMKPCKNFSSSVSSNQQECMDRLNAMGYLAVVCYGFEQAQAVIISYMADYEPIAASE